MQPLIKANELIEKFRETILKQHSVWNLSTENSFPIPLKFAQQAAKECALAHLDEIISITDPVFSMLKVSDIQSLYWHSVKEEIKRFEV